MLLIPVIVEVFLRFPWDISMSCLCDCPFVDEMQFCAGGEQKENKLLLHILFSHHLEGTRHRGHMVTLTWLSFLTTWYWQRSSKYFLQLYFFSHFFFSEEHFLLWHYSVYISQSYFIKVVFLFVCLFIYPVVHINLYFHLRNMEYRGDFFLVYICMFSWFWFVGLWVFLNFLGGFFGGRGRWGFFWRVEHKIPGKSILNKAENIGMKQKNFARRDQKCLDKWWNNRKYVISSFDLFRKL